MRVVTNRNQQVSRIDFESDHEVGPAIEDAIASQVDMRARPSQVILGLGLPEGRDHAADDGAPGGVRAVERPAGDRRSEGAAHRLLRRRRLVTPNHVEAESATNSRISTNEDARRASIALRQRLGVDSVLITRGEHGMWLDHAGVDGYLPASAREVADVTGAGDTVIATLALAIAAGATMPEAARLANEAASIVVGKFGAATVTPRSSRPVSDAEPRT